MTQSLCDMFMEQKWNISPLYSIFLQSILINVSCAKKYLTWREAVSKIGLLAGLKSSISTYNVLCSAISASDVGVCIISALSSKI